MIKVRTSLYATEVSIDNNLKIAALDAVKKYLGFYNRDIHYKLSEEDIVGRSKDKIGNISDANEYSTEFMSVEIESTIEDGYGLSLATINPDYYPIYKDNDIGASIKPIHVKMNYQLVINYYSKSIDRVKAAVERLRLAPATSNWELKTDFNYSYIIPGFIMDLLININDLKNTRLATPLSLEEYINKTFDDRVDTLNSDDGDANKMDLVIRETQLGVRGWIMDDLTNIKSEWDDGYNMEKLTLTYKFLFDKPVSLLSKYPILIYNNLLDKRFRIDSTNRDPIRCKLMKPGDSGLDKISRYDVSKYLTPANDNYHLNIPIEDNFKAELPDPYMVRLVSVLCVVDYNNPTALFNINEVPYIKFKDPIMDYLLYDYAYLSTRYSGMIYLELLKDGKTDYNNKIIVTPDLTLTTEQPMDIKSTYRVMFNALTFANMLNNDSITRISNFVKDQQALVPENEVVPFVDYFLDLYQVSGLPDIKNVSRKVDCDFNYLLAVKKLPNWTMMTVQTSSIFASLLEERD